jgi:phage gp45-like
MSYQSDRDIPRNVHRRVRVIEVKDEGPDQFVTVQGLKNEVIKLAISGQDFGLAGVPPVGSVGYLFAGNGRLDQGFLMGMRHPDYRVKGQAEGETSLYGKEGNRVHMKASGAIEITAKPGQDVHINPPTS